MLLSELLEGQKFFTEKSRNYGEISMVENIEDVTRYDEEYKTYRLLVSYYPLDQFGQSNGKPKAYTQIELTVA